MHVNIDSPGPTSKGTKITLPDGTELRGIRSAEIRLAVNEINEVDLHLIAVSFAVQAEVCSFYVSHPVSGEFKKIRRIDFEDGTEFSPEVNG
jgi:hypothetical protein